MEWMLQIGASWVPNFEHGPSIHPELKREDFFQDSFGCSLHVVAIGLRKLSEPKVENLKGGYSSDASLVFQSWLKDIQMYVLEHGLPQ